MRDADAVSLLTQAMEQTTTVEMVGFQALCSLPLGEAHLLASHPEEAQALAERALALTSEHQERSHQAYALRLLGDIAMHHALPDINTAAAYYRQAQALAEELGMRPLVAHCHLGLGKLYRRTGQSEEAQEHLTTATTMYREMGMTYWLEKAETELQTLT